MFEKNPALVVIAALCLCLVSGFIGWTIKPVPDPVIEVTIHGVFVNGKKVDLSALKLLPPILPGKDGKKKPGDVGEVIPGSAAMIIDQDPLNLNGPHMVNLVGFVDDSQPVIQQRGGGSEFLGLDRIIDRLIAWLSDKGKETETALARREEALSRGWENFKIAGLVAMAVLGVPLVWGAVSLQRIADNSAVRVMQMTSLQKLHEASLK